MNGQNARINPHVNDARRLERQKSVKKEIKNNMDYTNSPSSIRAELDAERRETRQAYIFLGVVALAAIACIAHYYLKGRFI